jgi:XTP/dITP diphosphohydrolase
MQAMCDDSGLVVDALNGGPGIFSARFAGPGADAGANNQKLLSEMSGVPESERGAHFYCAMALVRHAHDPVPLLATGTWNGRIMEAPAGDRGFGYDPLFWVPGEGCSSAELPTRLKNQLSHRGQALSAMMEQMAEL